MLMIDEKVIEELKERSRGAEDDFDSAVNEGILGAVQAIEKKAITFSDDEIQKHCKELCIHYVICELGENPPLQHGAMKACNLIEKLKRRGP